jgi:L-glutamine-phosphate cytidylyltransferase
MRPIVIGAGRGSRLRHETEEIPKTLVSVMGRPMIEWILEALAEAGFARNDVVYVCGYKGDVIRARYPEFTFVENRDWASNNILLSLLCARSHMVDGFFSTYSDIVYRGEAVTKLAASKHDMTIVCDTDWRRRYTGRSEHPETDAEKLRAEGSRVVEMSRKIPSDEASGEFIGVTRFTKDGAAELLDAFDTARAAFAGGPFREGRTFEKAYLIDLFQWMVERGSAFHRVDMHGGYMELDTLQDLSLAERWWKGEGT